ncbi:hypothetical protein [Ahrensia sp. 13_GOM-1096m]|uniref:hypothetical protein n=1 Tax=Ahrensia sp. 13_GOM-1096m TaxID=1380380 RepID=UPI001FFF17AB|nr:hypothetical protein [Ahrensia sp. 13_GOM-1096m]
MTKFRSRIKPRNEIDVRAGGFSLPRDAGLHSRDLVVGVALAALGLILLAGQAIAGQADIVGVDASQSSDKSWRFSVTVKHDDAGWDHYADKWAVFAPDGTMLGERVLAHPHDNEQPFTRSKSGILIDEAINVVTVKAHDKVHGWGSDALTYELKR